jgi:hypothetical protein
MQTALRAAQFRQAGDGFVRLCLAFLPAARGLISMSDVSVGEGGAVHSPTLISLIQSLCDLVPLWLEMIIQPQLELVSFVVALLFILLRGDYMHMCMQLTGCCSHFSIPFLALLIARNGGESPRQSASHP